jgi:hypothetical protein
MLYRLLFAPVVMLVCTAAAAAGPDWLLDPSPYKARVVRDEAAGQISLDNGLVRRTFRIRNGCATVALENLVSGEQLVRSVRPEAVLTIDDKPLDVGGLAGQPVQNYLDPRWLERMKPLPGAMELVGVETGKTQPRFPWKKHREWMPQDLPWPPPGVGLTLRFRTPAGRPAATVNVHYELYDGLPVLSKWLVLKNIGPKPLELNKCTSEVLSVVEGDSVVDPTERYEDCHLLAETDYTFGGMSGPNHSAGVHWVPDPHYGTQVNYDRKTPCLLECRPPYGPDEIVPPDGSFTSLRTFEMPIDTNERERRGLALRRMYRTIAPWVIENPVLMHAGNANPNALHGVIDQCADVGFEMVIMTFGSGFNFENRDPKYQAHYKQVADYARTKGIALGGYSLLASRGAGKAADNTQGVPARFGVMPCLGAQWGADYLAQLKHFIATAGLGVLEHDGSYPGDQCAATTHPFHRGLDDSQWVNWKAITGFYQWCRGEGVYLNIPDWYFLNGGSKTGMGYRETNWSLPREYQEIIERQNIFDGTWEKTPSMGWMFVPLMQYHGGGAAATIEPLKEHLPHYGQRLANLFGAGVQACYRGPRLYDAPETRALVKHWVDFYKQHRGILDSDIIHLRRADGRDVDYILHVNPALEEKALLMVYNPLAVEVRKTLTIPLYYSGLSETAVVHPESGQPSVFRLDRDRRIELPVVVPAHGATWFVMTAK